jgi:hypothetical protein
MVFFSSGNVVAGFLLEQVPIVFFTNDVNCMLYMVPDVFGASSYIVFQLLRGVGILKSSL